MACMQAVPYWIDDASLMPYMLVCAEPTSENNEEAGAKERAFGTPAAPVNLAQQAPLPTGELHPVHQRNSQALDLFNSDENLNPSRALLPCCPV